MEGKASAYVFASLGTKKWDTCGPEAILHAVGGKDLSWFQHTSFIHMTIPTVTTSVQLVMLKRHL